MVVNQQRQALTGSIPTHLEAGILWNATVVIERGRNGLSLAVIH